MMKNYFKDKEAMYTPWIKSSFFYKLLNTLEYSDKDLSKKDILGHKI